MKKIATLFVLTTFCFTSIFEGGTLAFAMSLGTGATQGGNQSAQLGQISDAAGPVQSFQADLFTGRAQTSLPIFVPPGRKNVQPNLSLNYSSSGGNGWLGVGWALDLGFIQRNIKDGAPTYDSNDTFVFSFQGVYSELVEISTNEYRAKDEALFLKFVHDTTNDKWVVTDKSGTEHIFGGSASCRQAGPSSNTFRWQLSKVKDTKGNYMSISHTTDEGHVYLSSVEYNGNETQSFSHTHKVEFTLEDRTDDFFSYISGAKDGVNKRLKTIDVKVKDNLGIWNLARRYDLAYEYSAATKRSRLISVEECGGPTALECLPKTEFVYQNKALQFNTSVDVTNIQRFTTSSTDTKYDVTRASSSDTATKGSVFVDLLDMNGDGFTDRLLSEEETDTWKVQWGQAESSSAFADVTTFGEAGDIEKISAWTVGEYFISFVTEDGESASDLVDMNGDGLPDRIMATDDNTAWKIQLNQEGESFDAAIDWTGVERFTSGTASSYDYIRYSNKGTDYYSTLVDLIDMNGDGLPDRVQAKEGETNWKVQLNNGSGFDSMQNWGPIAKPNSESRRDLIRYTKLIGSGSGSETVTDLIDLNGDGLPDRVHSEDQSVSSTWSVQWNTGSGFTSSLESWGTITRDPDVTSREHVRFLSDSGEAQSDLFDINADGLPDRIQGSDNNTAWKIQYNTGTGFNASTESFTGIEKMATSVRYSYPRWTNDNSTIAVDMADLTGDGLPDRIQAEEGTSNWELQVNKGPYPDLLSVVKNGRGAETEITYSKSTEFDNTPSGSSSPVQLPFPIWAVTQVDQKDGMGNTYTTTYAYKGGLFEADEREFRGFREVTVTDAVGTETRHVFGQGSANKGRILSKEVWGCPVDSNGKLPTTIDLNASPTLRCNGSQMMPFSKEETTWASTNPHTGVTFVYVSQQDNSIYDGDGHAKQVRQAFTYDSYGNLASTTEYGDISVDGDERKTVNTYIYNTSDRILNTLKQTTLYDDDTGGSVVAERYFYYDQTTSIATSPTAGLLFKEEEWLSTATGCGTPGVCANNPKTTMTYDAYGNVATITDARGSLTTNTYDSVYHLFLVEIKNHFNHTRSFTYDELIAQILTSTDQNGQVTTTEYDGLGRVTKVYSAEDSSAKPTQEFFYDFPNLATCGTSCVTKTTTKVKSSEPTATLEQLITYSFTDGLGREIQRRSPDEDSGKQIITGIVEFDERGQVSKEYTPFKDSTNTSSYRTHTQMGVSTMPNVEFFYDAVGRRTRIEYPDATNSKVVFNDFVKTTTDQRGKDKVYTNDAYGRLAQVDEKNSENTYTTTYEYDVLNNLIKTTDHLGNQTTVTYDSLSRKTGMTDPDMGTWSYEYDLNDNLTKQTDAKSQVIEFSYDALNRVTLKNLPAGETDVAYTYDDCETALDTATSGACENADVGRLAKVQDVSGTHLFAYDILGRVVLDRKTVSGQDYDFSRTYDSLGRVRTLTYPDGERVEYLYNDMGDVEIIRGCESGNAWASCAAPDKVEYVKDVDYNAAGQITFTQFGNDVESKYTYDPNTLRLSSLLTADNVVSPNTTFQDLSYTFDNNGNVTAIVDNVVGNGHAMTQNFTYDDLNRLTNAKGSAYGGVGAAGLDFVYDAVGNMTTKDVYTGSGFEARTMSYGEGSAGPHAVTSVSGSHLPKYCEPLQNCTFEYDANGNMTKRGVDELTYDSENRLTSIDTFAGTTGTHNFTLAAGWNAISFTYLPQDKSVTSVLSDMAWGTDYSQVSYWDESADEWKHFVNDSDFNDFDAFEYGKTYKIYIETGAGETASVTGKSPGIGITHNILSGDNYISPAVTTSTAVTTVLSGVTYDAVKKFDTGTDTWVAATNFEPGVGYKIEASGSDSFEYGENKTTTTYTYDSTGARVKKVVGATTTTYLGKDYIKEGSDTTKYIFLGDRRIAQRKNTDGAEFIHGDHINSSNVITDSSGNRVGYHEYDPYGTTVVDNPNGGDTSDPRYKFTGQEEDSSAGLYNYNARQYDPELGRFITADRFVQDPTDPQTLNRYAYARNNPIKFVDPTGNIFGIIAAIVGAVIAAAAAASAAYGAAVAFVAAGLAAIGITGTVGTILAGAIVGAAVGAALSAVDAAIQGRSIGRAAAFGAIAGAVGGAVGGTLGVAAEKMGMQTVLGIARVGLGSYATYQAVRNESYFSAVFIGLNTIHTSTIVAKQIQGTVAPSQTPNQSKGSQNNGRKSFQEELNEKEIPMQKSAQPNEGNALTTSEVKAPFVAREQSSHVSRYRASQQMKEDFRNKLVDAALDKQLMPPNGPDEPPGSIGEIVFRRFPL